MELTIEQLKEYLKSLGITLPDFVLEIIVEQMAELDECLLEHGVGPGVAKLIKLYLAALLGMAQSDKFISSQTAPSGASRSFRYNSPQARWNSTLGLLRLYDKWGCTGGLIPEDPFIQAFGFLDIADGSCPEN